MSDPDPTAKKRSLIMLPFRVAEGAENNDPILIKCYERTQKAVLALQFWQTSLDSWRYMKKVPPEFFEAAFALLLEANLEEWAKNIGVEALRIAVVEREDRAAKYGPIE